jgi:hypothetical protein
MAAVSGTRLSENRQRIRLSLTDISASNGGAVYISSTFTMSSGEISGNSASSSGYSEVYGGGMYVDGIGAFTTQSGPFTPFTSQTQALR